MSSSTAMTQLILLTLVGIGIFLILREFFAWYWKVNQIVALLKEIRDRLPAPPQTTKPAPQFPEY